MKKKKTKNFCVENYIEIGWRLPIYLGVRSGQVIHFCETPLQTAFSQFPQTSKKKSFNISIQQQNGPCCFLRSTEMTTISF